MPGSPPLQTLLDALEHDAGLREPDALRERFDALDRIELLQLGGAPGPGASALRIVALREDFEAMNTASFAHAREAIRRGVVPALLQRCLDEPGHAEGDGYDWRDELVEGVLQLRPPSAATGPLPADMVAYQPTPARHIFDLLAQARLGAHDVLVDLGSGLGHVPLLAAICSEAASIGIEREASYVECAQAAADALRLSRARFLCMDARTADFAEGTLFYLYTPFRGAVLRAVLDALQREAQCRPLRVAAHGPIVTALTAESWLTTDTPPRPGRITLFKPRH